MVEHVLRNFSLQEGVGHTNHRDDSVRWTPVIKDVSMFFQIKKTDKNKSVKGTDIKIKVLSVSSFTHP